MEFPNYFADAESDLTDAFFVLFGVPFEKTSSFRHGADKAPFEVRQASWNFERYDLRTNISFEDIALHDYGDLPVQNLNSQEVFTATQSFTSTIIAHHKIPIAIGGDHSITPGIITAFLKISRCFLLMRIWISVSNTKRIRTTMRASSGESLITFR
jgi:agmatinase